MEDAYKISMQIADNFSKKLLRQHYKNQSVKDSDIDRILEKPWSELSKNFPAKYITQHQEVFDSAYAVLTKKIPA